MIDDDFVNWVWVAMHFECKNDTNPVVRVFTSEASALKWRENIADMNWSDYFDEVEEDDKGEDEDDDNNEEEDENYKPADRKKMADKFWERANDENEQNDEGLMDFTYGKYKEEP